MAYSVIGLHHVTATVDEAQPDLDFCIGALGLRLVKKTVNFDNHHVYHFYYGDERGRPGTIWTTFPYHARGVRTGVKGAGQVTVTSFSVPGDSLRFWKDRLEGRGLHVDEPRPRFEETSIVAIDPSGLAIELVATDSDERQPWLHTGLDRRSAIRGLHSVSLMIREPEPTIAFMRATLGFEVADQHGDRTRLVVGGGGPGKSVDVIHRTDAPPAVNGLGTVHHVAFATVDPEDQLRLRRDLLSSGRQVTEVKDRQYFQSIYFREPGGVLFEVATTKPGFTVDEPLDRLGLELKLPPWEEPHRASIEAGLATVKY